VDALDISMVEVHGTGTVLGDPIEVGGLRATLGRGRSENSPVILAAVKSIIGHAEGAAGVAGVIKMVASMKYMQIPMNLHLKKLNPSIDLTEFPVIMPNSIVKWNAASTKSGTSSFGFSGTNSHAILEGPESIDKERIVLHRAELVPWNRTPHCLHDWSQGLWYSLEWQPVPLPASSPEVLLPCLVVGGGEVSEALQNFVPDCSLVQPSKAVAALEEQEWSTVVFVATLVAQDPLLESGVINQLLDVARAALSLGRSLRFVVATKGAQKACSDDSKMAAGLAGAAAWGFMRTMPWDAPKLIGQAIDFAADACSTELAEALRDELCATEVEPEVAYFDGVRKIPRLVSHRVPQTVTMMKFPETTQLLTGGLGGLGLLTAQTLVDMGAQSILLVSRKGCAAPGETILHEMLHRLEQSPAAVHAWSCDVSNAEQVHALVERVQHELPNHPLRGVVHCAGILDCADLSSQTPGRIAAVFKPKVSGAWHLHEATKLLPLESFILFSSISALIGLSWGTSYSSSNAYLDGLALWRRACGLTASSLQWGPVAEVGMASKNFLFSADSALKLLKPGQVQAAFRQTFLCSSLPPSLTCAPADWSRFLRELGTRVPVLLDYGDMGEEQAVGKCSVVPPAFEGTLEGRVEARAGERTDDLTLEAPLIESGLDSWSADGIAAAVEATKLPAGWGSVLLEALNTRAAGVPIFLVPGAGMQASGFRALASLLPVPAYGLSWPKGICPRIEWPATLKELAGVFFEEVRKQQPAGPYCFAGHSFGAAVCLEMAKVAEEQNAKVSLVALMDPRHLGGESAHDVGAAYATTGLTESLALLSQILPAGSRYLEALQEISHAESSARDTVARRVLSPDILASLEHVRETTEWYSTLLTGEGSIKRVGCLQARIAVLRAAETWHTAPASETVAEEIIRQFQALTFQDNDQVSERIRSWCNPQFGEVVPMKVPGTHFSMLHEPNVVAVVLRLCRALDETEEVA